MDTFTHQLRIIHIGINECQQLVTSARDEDVHICITRLDSILSVCNDLNSYSPNVVPTSVVSLVENAMNILVKEGILSAGRPPFQISMSQLEFLLSLNFKVTKIAEMLGVSIDTVFRRMRQYGLSVHQTYSNVTDQELAHIVYNILSNHPSTGYKRMKGYLLSQGIRVTDQRVTQTMRIVDPQGVYERTLVKNSTIHRRQYSVQYSNEIWHLDGNLKLIRWGFVIRCGIDGKSRTVTYISATTDNKANTHLDSFLKGVHDYGIPLRTRSDKGGENIRIAMYMLEKRGIGKRSPICGKSVHNQRIERFWRDVHEGCTETYIDLFHKMEDDGTLNVDDEIHMYVLHKVFLPRLNNHITTFVHGWNNHPLSTEHNYTPKQLMLMSLLPVEDAMFPKEVDVVDGEIPCNAIEDIRMFQESLTQPIFVPPDLNDRQLNALNGIDFLGSTSNYGYDIYVRTLNTINSLN